MSGPLVGILMGSDSDHPVMSEGFALLECKSEEQQQTDAHADLLCGFAPRVRMIPERGQGIVRKVRPRYRFPPADSVATGIVARFRNSSAKAVSMISTLRSHEPSGR